MKSGTESKLKFKKLQRAFGLSLWQARGLLDTLWSFTANNCPAGDIGKFSDDEIAIGIDWADDATKLITSLVETGWLDTSETHRLIIHDWPDHCEDSIHMALARRREFFADGSKPKLTRLSKDDRESIAEFYSEQKANGVHIETHTTEQDVHGERTTEPYRTIPNHTEPNQALPSPNRTEPKAERTTCDSASGRDGVFKDLKASDLRDVGQMLIWFARAKVITKLKLGSENSRQLFIGAALKATEEGDDPIKLFMHIVTKGDWRLVTNVYQEKARKRLAEYDAEARRLMPKARAP